MFRTICVALCLLLTACAAPTTQRIQVSNDAQAIEVERQMDIAFEDRLRDMQRVRNIYAKLAVNATDICVKNVRPMLGVFAATVDDFKEFAPSARRLLNLDSTLKVIDLTPGMPAEQAGLKKGDVIKLINGRISPTGQDAQKELAALLEEELKKSPDSITVMIERADVGQQITVKPIQACGYRPQLVSGDAVNAYATGEILAVTTGMMRFVRDDTELTLVIAHELAHNAMSHIDAKKQNAAVGAVGDILLAILTRGAYRQSSFSQAGAGAYSQDFEAEADYVGLYVMARTGVAIDDAPRFWRRMGAANPSAIGNKSHTASHPSTAERMLALEKAVVEIKEKQSKGLPLVPEKKAEAPKTDTPSSQNQSVN